MFKNSTRQTARYISYFKGTNYTSRPIYQYNGSTSIIDELPAFIPKEEVVPILDSIINSVVAPEVSSLNNTIEEIRTQVGTNTIKIQNNELNLETLERYTYSQSG